MLARLKAGIRSLVGWWRGPRPVRVLTGAEIGKDIEIASLVCPLRYDIVVKRDFLLHYAAHADQYASDFDAFARAPAAQAYSTFLKESRIRRYRPRWYESPERLRELFREAARRCVELHDSLTRNGFDVTRPIVLRAGVAVEHEQNVDVNAEYYAGDGCHRIAWLWGRGYGRLPRDYYEANVYRTLRPLDTTAQLIEALRLSPAEYARYLATYYCDGRDVRDLDGVVAYVAAHKPHKAEEVASVIREHAKHF